MAAPEPAPVPRRHPAGRHQVDPGRPGRDRRRQAARRPDHHLHRIGHRHAKPGRMPAQAPLHQAERRALLDQRRAGPVGPGRAIRQRVRTRRNARGIVEVRAVAGIEIALAGQPLRQQHVMRVQFDMPIGDAPHRLLHDRRVVHQMPHRDQHAIDEHRMIGRQHEVADRPATAKGAGGDAHRVHVPGSWMRGRLDAAAAEPTQRRQATGPADQPIIRAQVLHLPPRRARSADGCRSHSKGGCRCRPPLW